MKSNRGRILITLIITLILGSIIGYLMREQIRQIVVIPVAYLIWYTNLVFDAAPQWLLWYLLLAFGAYYSVRLLAKGVPADEMVAPLLVKTRGASRYQFWLWYIGSFHDSHYSQELLARGLFHLITDIIMYQEHLDYTEVVALIDSGELNVPPEILEFLRARKFWDLARHYNWLDRVIDRLQLDRVFRRINGGFHLDEASGKLDHIISFIEERLEVQRD